MVFDIIPGNAGRMAQLFPEATARIHYWDKPCWCHPFYRFTRSEEDGNIYGQRVHR